MSELFDFMKSFCGDDVTRPTLSQPWMDPVRPRVYASNGYVAIRVLDNSCASQSEFEVAVSANTSGSIVRAIDSYFSPTSKLLNDGRVDEFRLSLDALGRWRRAALIAEDNARSVINAEPTSEFRDADDFFEDSFTDWVRSVALVELQGNFFRSHAIRKICDAVEFSRRYCDEGAIPFPRIRVRSHRNPIVWCSLPCIDVVAMGVYSVSGGLMNSFAVADAASGKLKHKMKG